MELKNFTPFPALLFRGCLAGDRLAAAIVCRVTYDLVDGRLVESGEQPWIVSAAPWTSPRGPMDSDEVFYRGGVDLFVFGSARAPGGRPARSLEVSVELGEFRSSCVVFGERRWRRTLGGLVPSEPELFTEIPLDLEHAYGGKDLWDGLEVAFPDNPAGRGFSLDRKSAVGRPLPNIEDPRRLIRRWDDRPEPVGTTAVPISFGPRLRQVVFDEATGSLLEIRPTFFNAAFPGMVAPEARPGARLTVRGVREDGALSFELPRSGLGARLVFGNETIDRSLSIDQIGVEADRDRVFISYRYPFRYPMVFLQRRWCELEIVAA